jgi:hypothetical protein
MRNRRPEVNRNPLLYGACIRAAVLGCLSTLLHASGEDPHVRTPLALAPGVAPVCEFAVGSDVELSLVLFKDCAAGESLRFVRSDGRGLEWTPPLALPVASLAHKQVQRDSVHVIGTRAFAVWSDDESGASATALRFARFEGGAWSAPVAVATGLPAGVDVSAWKAVARPGPSGDVHVYVLASVRGAATGGADHAFLLVSTDAGASFLPALAVSSAASSVDVEGLAIDVQGTRLIVAWSDDRHAQTSLGAGDDLWVRVGDVAAGGSVSWTGPEQQLDAPLGPSTTTVHGDPIAAIEGLKGGVAWLEDGLSNGNDQLVLRRTEDAGVTWSSSDAIGAYNPWNDTVVAFDFELVGPVWTLAWEDDRGGVHQVYRSESKDGAGFPETQLSTAGGHTPLLSRSVGQPSGATVVYVEETPSGPVVAAFYADQENGAEWHTEALEFAGASTTAPGTVPVLGVAYNHRYYNFVIPFLAGPSAVPFADEIGVTGFRPPTVYAEGFVAGPANPWFELGHVPFEDLFGFVVVAFAPSTGQLLLPDGRETGLAFDALTTFGLQHFALFFAANDPVARGVMTTPLTTNLPSGFQFFACGVTIGPDLALRHLTDRVEVLVP